MCEAYRITTRRGTPTHPRVQRAALTRSRDGREAPSEGSTASMPGSRRPCFWNARTPEIRRAAATAIATTHTSAIASVN
ncbi:hypothetical protein DC31_00315 [Microbacterium sp. CH12i]|nr:hypothetical protein DC31_00315 [Microbacterium sp. CH12i]